jgi:hypothetical protein
VWLDSVETLGPEFHSLVTSDISHYKHYLMVALDIFLTIFIRERDIGNLSEHLQMKGNSSSVVVVK